MIYQIVYSLCVEALLYFGVWTNQDLCYHDNKHEHLTRWNGHSVLFILLLEVLINKTHLLFYFSEKFEKMVQFGAL